jgi:hypothetical protein
MFIINSVHAARLRIHLKLHCGWPVSGLFVHSRLVLIECKEA